MYNGVHVKYQFLVQF